MAMPRQDPVSISRAYGGEPNGRMLSLRSGRISRVYGDEPPTTFIGERTPAVFLVCTGMNLTLGVSGAS
jgi:hypothetical protein